MGTVASFDVTAAYAGAPLAEAIRWLHWVDGTFSPFVPDSEVSRLARGEISVADCAPEVAEVLAACESLTAASGGYFSARYAGRLDPSGYVKGWAIERAAALLTAAGSVSHCVNGGGDVQCVGTRSASGRAARPAETSHAIAPDVSAETRTESAARESAGEPWRIGIADPSRPGALIRVVTGSDFAVATSGVAERGPHIVDPHTGLPADEFLSVTVVGPRLALADAYATAATAMGAAARAWIEGLDGYCAFALRADGTSWQTTGFADHVAIG